MDVRVEIDDNREKRDRERDSRILGGDEFWLPENPRAMIFFLSLKINFFSSSSSSFSSLPGGCFTKERLLSALIVYRRISSEQSIYRFHFQFVSSPLSRSRSSLFDSRRSRVVSKERISLFTSLVGRPIFIIANQSFHLARRQVSSTAFVLFRSAFAVRSDLSSTALQRSIPLREC